MVTFADVFRAYVKPSLKGRLILRKRTSTQTSARLAKRKMTVAENPPAERAYDACVRAGDTVKKRVYVAGQGYVEKDVCPIDKFRRYLREAMPK